MPFFDIDVPVTKYSDSWPTEAFLQMQTAYKLAKENNQEANQCMKERFDRKTKERTFEVGDTVMISYPPNTPQAGRQIGNKKFEQIWRPNYKVIEKLALHTYKVQLTPHSLPTTVNVDRMQLQRSEKNVQPKAHTDINQEVKLKNPPKPMKEQPPPHQMMTRSKTKARVAHHEVKKVKSCITLIFREETPLMQPDETIEAENTEDSESEHSDSLQRQSTSSNEDANSGIITIQNVRRSDTPTSVDTTDDDDVFSTPKESSMPTPPTQIKKQHRHSYDPGPSTSHAGVLAGRQQRLLSVAEMQRLAARLSPDHASQEHAPAPARSRTQAVLNKADRVARALFQRQPSPHESPQQEAPIEEQEEHGAAFQSRSKSGRVLKPPDRFDPSQ
jgi:hypothetical protein